MNDKITNYIKAGYPGLFIVSYEESRVESVMRDVLDALTQIQGATFHLSSWSLTEGVVQISRGGKAISDTQDPMPMLDSFIADEDGSIYLLRDFHVLIEDRNPLVWRKVRDALAHAKLHSKCLILLGCRQTLPPELAKEITVMEFQLPDRARLHQLLQTLLVSYPNAVPEDAEAVVRAAGGLTTIEAENAFALSIIETGKVCPTVVHREKVANVKKTGLLEVMESKLTLEDIGGLHSLKAWLIERKNHFTDKARQYRLPLPRGIMMVGQPGCGKTETAKACGAVFGLPILRLEASKLFGSLVGQTEGNFRVVYETAKAMAPVILFVDEIDGLGGTGDNLDSGVTDRVVKAILQAMDEKGSGVYWIGTANDIDKIKTPILRRFDEVWNVELPTQHEREAIFAIQLARVGRNPAEFNLKEIATAALDFSGAEIEKAVSGALTRGFAEDREPNTADLLHVVSEFVPLARTAAKDIAARRERLKNVAKLASGPVPTATSASGKAPVKRKLATFGG